MGEHFHIALQAFLLLLIRPNIDGFCDFFFQICWSLIGDFRRIFSRQIYLLLIMATKTVATWSAARIAFPKTVQYNKMSKLSC